MQQGAASGALKTLLKNELITIRRDGSRHAHALRSSLGPLAAPRQLTGTALAASLDTELAEREEHERRAAAIPLQGGPLH